MRRILLSLLVLASIPHPVLAQVDVETECSDRPECWPDGSSMRTGLLLVQRQEVVDQIMQKKHEELVRLVSSSSSEEFKVDERLLAALKRQQTAWLQYRLDECELIGSLTGAGGTWPSTYANKCVVNHAEQRLRRINAAIACIGKIPNERRRSQQNTCLQQLAPLTNK